MFSSKYSTFLTVLLIIAIVAIVGLLGFWGYDVYKKWNIDKNTSEVIAQFEEEVEAPNLESDLSSLVNQVEGVEGSGSNSSGGKRKVTYQGFEVAGTIEIPTINLKYPILTPETKKSLELSVVLRYGVGLNQVGNTVIAGHNYRNGTMFSNVKKLKNGDIIYITDANGLKVKYEVYNVYETTGEDATYMNRDTGGKREISLTTCTDDSKSRTIVWAKE